MNKICPINKLFECAKKECAWWVIYKNKGMCVVKALMEKLNEKEI